MTICALKVCRNYRGRLKTTKKVTYHRIPKDPILRSRWIEIIRKSRGEDLWQPSKTSVICSDHFRAKDLYFANNQSRQRLKKEAIPCKALFLSSLETDDDESDGLLEETGKIGDRLTNVLYDAKIPGSNEEESFRVTKDNHYASPFCMETSDNIMSSNITGIESGCTSSHIPGQATSSKIGDGREKENESDIIKDFSDLESIFDTPKKSKLRRDLRRRIRLQTKHTLKIQSLRRKNLRLKKKIASFKQIIGTLKKERYIDSDIHNILSDNVFAADLYSSMKKKLKGSKRPVKKYAPEFRKFCLTLHFLSPKAYSYVRRKFETCLPHPKTLSKWYSNIDGSPGLTEDAFKILKIKRNESEKNMICSLIADEMAIRQQKCFNRKTLRDEGLVDIGSGPADNINVKASEAYVFLLVSLNEPWKLPVAYFLIHGMTGEQKANIIKTVLYKCHEVGIDVVSLTFDGHRSNLSAMEVLGCNYKNPKELKTTFKHPCADYEVAVFLDFCHMLKLIRNHFESKEVFLYKDDEIKWVYVKKLAELQEETGLHLANHLTKKHIQFRNSIMNIKLATQLLSRSVSVAIEFCRQELKLPDFLESGATEKFIMIMNNVFDTFNSRNLQAHGYKHPLFPGNKNEVFAMLEDAKDLILNLSLKESRKRAYKEHQISKKLVLKSYVPVLKSQSFTGFLGVLICINSLKFLYDSLIESKKMKYLTTYRISQDHLELFFGAIRMHGGYNDNPNARQLKGIYRKLLCHMELKSASSGNCVPLENISILMCSSSLKCINTTVPSLRKDDDDEDESENIFKNFNEHEDSNFRLLDDLQLSDYTQQIVGYIAGFVVRCLRKKLKCVACIESLMSNEPLQHHKLVNMRDEGGLIYASHDVYYVCKTAENVLKKIFKQNFIMTPINYAKIVFTIMKQFVGGTNYFKVKTDHVCGLLHQVNLIRLVVEKYLDLRYYYKTKLDNINRDVTSKRKLFRKQIQREGH